MAPALALVDTGSAGAEQCAQMPGTTDVTSSEDVEPESNERAGTGAPTLAPLDTPEPPDPVLLAPLPDPASEQARAFAEALGLSTTAADVLHRRGHREVDATRSFLDPKLAGLSDPEAMIDRGLAADRLARAVRRGERVCVFGDYDCDGITSAAIMTGVLEALGGDVVTLLASRFEGGYGVSATAVDKIIASKARVLVTCDCGSSDHENLAAVTARGIDVIVIDHHLVPDEPLPVVAFLNPHRPDCGFSYKGMASCGLAVSVGAAVRKALGRELDLRPWMDLVAIGTIADVAPLDGDNRALVRAGLRVITRAERPGTRALLELARLRGARQITGEDVAYRLAPRINAPGRLGSPTRALDLLLASSDEVAAAVAAEIDQMSKQRREIQDQMVASAIEEIEREGWGDRAGIVVGREGWNHGIVGIVAGNLVRRYGKPVAVVGFEGGTGRGSVRGPKGARLYDALASAADCLERFGGHQAAAGLTVQVDRFGELREAFEAACARQAAGGAGGIEEEPGARVWLDSDDDPRQVMADFLRLEPCGQGNPTPHVVVAANVAEAREVKGGHLKLELEPDARGGKLGAFAPAMGERADSLSGGRVVVTGKLRLNTWRGSTAVELLVEQIR